ncbi:TetR family transcriptional regulator [Lysinibacillus fusiformis]|uniref:TetR family transcriptional regulator n=2 Tax=Lysinibacillus fusiformis TaxID=28031 RepID=A0A2I0UZW2_9BACI|nr:TetR family transcriptional regulator [Lysinibacillus fusiformis]
MCSTLEKYFRSAKKMSGKAEYKSAIRSRKMIRHAFVELVLEKDLEKITVKNIVERAEVSRGTFYAHYSDILAVIEEIENELMGKMVEFLNDFKAVEIIQNPMPLFLKMVDFLQQDIEFYRKLIFVQGASCFVVKLKDILIEKIISFQETIHPSQERQEFVLRVHFLVGGLMSMYQDWLAGKFDCSLEELTKSISRMMIQGLQSYTFK